MNQQRAEIRGRVTTLLPMVAYKIPKSSKIIRARNFTIAVQRILGHPDK
jgi:hypothetical protein